MRSGIRYLSTLAVLAIAMVALGYEVDRYLESPTIGSNFPKGTPTAEKAKIINVSGSTRPFPQGGFVVPAAVPGMIVEFTATRATHDWDTHEYGDDPCDMHRVPVEDVLKEGWPRWDPGHGDAYFLSRFPDDIPLYDKGTWVIMRSPEAPTDDPQGFYVRLYEEDKAQFADDYALTPWYGQLQDSVQMHIRQLVVLRIWNDGRLVSRREPGQVPEGPDAYNKLGLFHRSEYSDGHDDYVSWQMANTVDSNHNILDADKTGGAEYDQNHWDYWEIIREGLSLAYGTGLKTEMCATIELEDSGAPVPLPLRIREAMEGRLNWEVYQDYKREVRKNGSRYDDPRNVFQWTTDFSHAADDEHVEFHHPTTGVSDAWLYCGDAPGPARWGDAYGSVGDEYEARMMFRTGIRLKDDSGNVYVLVDANDHEWKAAGKMFRADDPPWIITEAMHPGGDWTIP